MDPRFPDDVQPFFTEGSIAASLPVQRPDRADSMESPPCRGRRPEGVRGRLPRLTDYVAQNKAQGREVREIQCDSVRDWIELQRSKAAEAGANTA